MVAVDKSDLDRFLVYLADLDGSDLHIKAGAPPRLRRRRLPADAD